jgi:hypothetical protein
MPQAVESHNRVSPWLVMNWSTKNTGFSEIIVTTTLVQLGDLALSSQLFIPNLAEMGNRGRSDPNRVTLMLLLFRRIRAYNFTRLFRFRTSQFGTHHRHLLYPDSHQHHIILLGSTRW